MNDAAIYLRLRTVCCGEWGCSPPEFERLAARGDIAAEDVMEALLWRACQPLGGNVMRYVFREVEEEKEQAAKGKVFEAQRLALLLRGETDDGKRSEILEALRRINEE